jgi:hypothetical protein
LQALPSLQELVLLECWQPEAGLQESSVQALPSLQLSAVPVWQDPPPQISLPLQALPSLQELVLLECWQPEAGLQESSVQVLLSLQEIVV